MRIKKTIFPKTSYPSHDEWREQIRIDRGGQKQENMEGMSFKSVIKSISAQNEMTMDDIAVACHKGLPSLHQQLDRGSPSLTQIKQIFNALGEDVVFITKNGNRFKLK